MEIILLFCILFKSFHCLAVQQTHLQHLLHSFLLPSFPMNNGVKLKLGTNFKKYIRNFMKEETCIMQKRRPDYLDVFILLFIHLFAAFFLTLRFRISDLEL